jgi:ribosomal protein S18 acetylase RimI-like enzyme
VCQYEIWKEKMRAQELGSGKLVIFDIDDTLVNTDTRVNVVQDGKIIKQLNSHDFTHYKLGPGESFDFGAFKDAREFFTKAKPIPGMIRQLKQDIATGNRVIMLTARSDFNDRDVFLDTFRRFGIDMDRVHVYRAGNLAIKAATEEKKKIILKHLLGKEHFDKLIMYDDSVPNLNAFLSLKQDYPYSKFYAWHVDPNGQASEYHRTDEGAVLEIARIPQGDYGTAGTIDTERVPDVDRKELPGGSGLTYGINQKDTEFLEIMIFDQDEIVGELDLADTRGPMKTWSVENLAVDPQHRGRGIAKALYGIALSILRLPVEAGQLQTGYGQKMWLMLNSIPGVQVVGSAMDRTSDYRPRPADNIVYQDENYTHYTFPVRAGRRSMRSTRPGTGIYTRPDTTMIARWTGQ